MRDDLSRAFNRARRPVSAERLRRLRQINLQLAALSQPGWQGDDENWLDIADDMLRNYRQHRRLLQGYRCPADQRIQDFVNAYLANNGVDSRI